MNINQKILEDVFSDFGTSFIVNEPLESNSLLRDYLSHNGVEDEEIDDYINAIRSIADIIEWRKAEFNQTEE